MANRRKTLAAPKRNLAILFQPEERQLIQEVAEADLLPVSVWARRILLRAARAQADRSREDVL